LIHDAFSHIFTIHFALTLKNTLCIFDAMKTVDDIFDAFNGPAEVARTIGKRTEHATAMRRRKSIPVAYWPRLVDGAKARGLNGITYDALVAAHAERTKHPEPAQ
jgi:hypothetical protein